VRHTLVLGLAALFLGTAIVGISSAQDDKPKFTIKEIMQQAHKDKLLNKVLEGKANAEEKATLALLYLHLGKNAPPKGENGNWKKLTDALATAAKEVEQGKEGALDRLKAASNCGACHKAHK